MPSQSSKERILIYGIVFVTALIFRLLTLQVPETGGDSMHYFDCAWQLWHAPQSYQLDHQSVRWGIILPLALLRPLSWDPLLYPMLALAISLVTVIIVLRAGELLHSLFTGTLAALIVLFFPGVIDVASNVLPEHFLLLYLSLTTMLLLEYRRRSAGGEGFLIAGALTFVLAWWSKVTVVEFLPAFLFLVYQRGRWVSVWKFFGIFAGAVIFETVVYRLVWQEPLGVVSVILHSHLSAANDTMTTLTSLADLFGRYAPNVFRFYWWPLMVVVFAVLVVLLRRRAMGPVWFLVIGSVLFFLGLTFGIKSLQPLVTLEPFVTRYFITVLPFVALFAAYGVAILTERWQGRWLTSFSLSLIGLVAIAAVVSFIALPIIPSKWKTRFLPLDRHPFVVLPQYGETARIQRRDHLPVFGFNPGDPALGQKAATAYFVLFDRHNIGDWPPMAPRDAEVGPGAFQLGSDPLPTSETAPVIWVQAEPLNVRTTTWGELRTQGAKP